MNAQKGFHPIVPKIQQYDFFSFVQTLFAALQCNSLAHHSQGVVGTAVGPNAEKNSQKCWLKNS